MATLKTMNRRRRRMIEPGVIVGVYEVRNEAFCLSYERFQGRRISRHQPRGAPFRTCKPVDAVEAVAAEMAEVLAGLAVE